MQTLHLAGFKLDLEWPLDVGLRVIEGGGQEKANPQKDEHKSWKALFDDLRGQYPNRSNAEIYRIVAGRLETSEAAVKKALQRMAKRVDT